MKLTPVLVGRVRAEAARLPRWQRPLDVHGNPLEPQLPRDLTALNDAQLGTLWTQFCAMVQWSKGVLTEKAVEAAELARREKIVRAKVFLLATGNREEKAAKVETHPDVQDVTAALFMAVSVERLAGAVHEGYLVGKEAVSREVTRRIALDQHRGLGSDLPSRNGRPRNY